MSFSITECKFEQGFNAFEFPFKDEEELPVEFQVEFSFLKGEVVQQEDESPWIPDDEDDVDDYRVSNAFKQVLEINKEPYSAAEYEAELKKRGAPFKHGLVNDYLRKFPFEDKEWLPNSEYFVPGYEKYEKDINAHEVVKRFLKQVRESNGYDVDCDPPCFHSPFYYTQIDQCSKHRHDHVMAWTQFVIDKINLETGETYELVQVQNIVFTMDIFYLLTFTVMKVGSNDDASLKTVRAMVQVHYRKNNALTLEEWMFKPPVTDMSRVDVDREKKKSTSNLVRLKTLATPICVVSALCWIAWVSLKKSSTRFHS